MDEFDQEAVTAIANATVTHLRSRYEGALVRAYIAETAVYDKRAGYIRLQALDNRVGRAAMRKKYEAQGLDTEGVNKVVDAYTAMRKSGVPSEQLTPLYNEINTAMEGPVALDEVEEELLED